MSIHLKQKFSLCKRPLSSDFRCLFANRKRLVFAEVATPTGTSYHSPGLVSASHPAHRYKPILAYSIELYSRLEEETGEPLNFERTGTIRLATNPTRYQEFKRYVARDYYKKGDICKTTLLSPEEVAEIAPVVDINQGILGALYTTNDGMISASGLNRALIAGAKKGGVQVVNSELKTVHYDKDKGCWYVELANGTSVTTRNLLNAGGIWANDIARLSGHELPMVIAEHQYASLTPNSSIPNIPAIIDHDSTFYIRKSGDSYIFGGFEPMEKVVFREDWYRNGVPPEGSKAVKPDFPRLEEAYSRACELVPSLRDAKVDANAAVFSMTADGYPLVGPFDKNYWVSTGFLDGVSSGGGIGKYIADWMVDGEPPLELFDTDASRYDRWATRQFILEKSRETYSMYYNWSYTDRLAARPTDRVSGIYGRLKRDKGVFSFRNGWEVPQAFNIEEEGILSTLSREYQMVTNKCGVIDMSWKGKIEVRGKDAEALLNYAICTEIPPLGKIGSGLMLTRQGRILAPLKIFHHDNTRSAFILLTEPERESRDIYWLRRAASEKKFDVQVNCVSEYLASLVLVGPNSRQLLSELTKSDVSEEGFPQRSTRLMRLGPVAVVCARSSTSTGQLSYEFFHNRADSAKLYQEILVAGAPYGVVNFGQATMNMMRLEHGYKIWGRELTLDTNPFECGLGGLVDFTNEDFIGRPAAVEMSKRTYDRRLALLTFDPADNPEVPLEWKSIPFGNEVIRREGQEERIGQITSGSYSVRLRRPIAFAWISSDIRPDEKVCLCLIIVNSSAVLFLSRSTEYPLCNKHI
ncbi:FAD dependent oxidoreductase [Oesophagostomum dentatum]|uniref:FAD dependent oxidoreductase n=1 Tax=Oesophagostomum dentatum TaxID=61180 RepID=A0A0B1T0Z6_OESDE|nr:FAD dependent oxidoreductase [Oesophagostomum dentatum]